MSTSSTTENGNGPRPASCGNPGMLGIMPISSGIGLRVHSEPAGKVPLVVRIIGIFLREATSLPCCTHAWSRFMGDAASLQLVTGSASCLAGAACLNSLSLPARLYLMSWYGRVGCVELERWRAAYIRRLRAEYRQFLRRNPDTPRRLQEPRS